MWIWYRTMRTFLVSVWFYFIPFIALALNFIVPYYAEAEPVTFTSGSSMDEEYEDYLTGVLGQVDNDYAEPSVEELVAMMDAVPFESEEYR